MVISEQFLTATTPATRGRQWCSPAQLWEKLQQHQCCGQGFNCSWPCSTSSVHLPCCISAPAAEAGGRSNRSGRRKKQLNPCTVLIQCLAHERAWNHFIKVGLSLPLSKSKAGAECPPGKEQIFLQITHTAFTARMQWCLAPKALGGSPCVQLHCTKVQTSY